MLVLSLLLGSVAPLAAPAEASAAPTINGQAVTTRRIGATRGRGGVELANAASLRTALQHASVAAVAEVTPGSMLIQHGSRELFILAGSRTAFLTTGVGTAAPSTRNITLTALPQTVAARDLFVPFADVLRYLGGSFTTARVATLPAAAPVSPFVFVAADPARDRDVVAATGVRMVGRGATFPNSLYGSGVTPAVGSWVHGFRAASQDIAGGISGYNVTLAGLAPGGTDGVPRPADPTSGSGVGVDAVRMRLADFGGTDMISLVPAAVLEAFPAIPTAKGGVAVIFNVADANGTRINHLNLTADTIARIYLGQISRWNDPALARLNPRVALPNQPIQVNWRPDVSGTTEIFTAYLNAASRVWRDTLTAAQAVYRTTVDTDDVVRAGMGGWGLPVIGPGTDGIHGTADDVRDTTRVQPANAGVGGSALRDRVNGGTAGQVTNAIGFVSYGDVVTRLAATGTAAVRNLGVARVQNRAGIFVLPLIANVYAAGIGHGNVLAHPVNSANPGAYPITGLTWIMVERDPAVAKPVGDSVQNPAANDDLITLQPALTLTDLEAALQRNAIVADFIRWAVVQGFGDAEARRLQMAPLTPTMKREAARLLTTIRTN
jgi:ABC-type phosphate transport system substrate-binding protein